MSAIIYDFKAISAKLRKQRIDDWWQPIKPEPEPQAAKPLHEEDEYWTGYAERLIYCC
jgi:hypothetical protein